MSSTKLRTRIEKKRVEKREMEMKSVAVGVGTGQRSLCHTVDHVEVGSGSIRKRLKKGNKKRAEVIELK